MNNMELWKKDNMLNRYFLLSFLFFIFSAITSYSTDVKFHNINDMHGISIRETASICKDDNGFIWTSSKTGILRLAGDDCRIYQLAYKTTDIYKVNLVCQNHVLLAYTNNGQVFRYNAVYDRFDFLFYMGQILDNRHLVVTSILVQNQSNFLIASGMGLYKYHEGELFPMGNDASEIQYAVWYDTDHVLLAKEKTILLMNIHTLESKSIYENTNLPAFRISILYYDAPDGKLWAGTVSEGLFYYDFNTGAFVRFPVRFFPRQPVRAITAGSDSTLLVGIDGQGIWEVNKTGDRVLNVYKESPDNPFSLRGDGVYDIFCDRERVWVCTYSGGLSFFVQTSPPVNQITHQVNNPNSLSNNIVNGIIEDRSGKIWFATDNGISCWDVQSGKWKTCYHNRQEQAQVFLSLCEDDSGRIWASTYSSGIYVIDAKTGKELAHHSKENAASPLSSNFISAILKDCNGDLWIGSVTGNAICYVSKENKFKTYSSVPVYAFAEFSSSKILMACTFGLHMLDKQTGDIEILLDGYMLQDLLLMDGYVWLCSSGDGLIRFDPGNKTIEKFTTETGLPSNYINSITEADGYLWLGAEAGLCRFDPKDKSVQTYSSLLSLSDVSFNRHAHCKLRNGQLAWGTNKGVLFFDPVALQKPQPDGRIFIQNILVSGRSVRDHSAFKLDVPLDSLPAITLNYDQNNLALELLPLGNAAVSSRFSWKMEGFDAGWSHASNHRILTYTNIPSGKYILKIRMYDDSLSQMPDERQLLIAVTPPFWKTTWFGLLTAFVMGSIFYFMLRFYINRLKQRHAEDKIRFFTNTAHDLRTALTLIKAPVEELNKELNLSEAGKYYLHIVAEQARRLSSTATHLLDFQKADRGKGQLSLEEVDVAALIAHRKWMFESFAESRQIELLFASTPSVYLTAIDKSMMEKVIDNLISNAVKYSNSGGSVQILFSGDAKSWTLEVKDQGIGISRKAQRKLFHEFYRSENAVNSKIVGSGIGLLLAKNYVTLHGGTVRCSSRENAGSSFKITVPFKKAPEKSREVPPAAVTPASEPEQRPVRNEEIRQRDMHILIVEDNDDLRNFMLHPLLDEFHVSTAEDGMQAWEMIREQPPDLVVSDVMMPNMDGFELCRRIKSTYETSHIPIVLLTALTGNAEQLHGLGLGADDYLTKPFDMPLLLQRIRSIIRNRNTIREKALKLIKRNDNEPILTNELNDKFLKKALEVIHANMANERFGKNEFASAMNVSATLLHTKIKSLTDQSPAVFVKSIRLTHALELLQSHKYTVTEVSEMCGFSNIGYFSMAFKSYFGKSPTKI
jgi:signal transduction histidine kinase/DNA-binding response OmpR family regulator/ligand-binding sensor domain-containing protein